MKRVMIVGMSGAGKSTLCREVARKLIVACHHLDNIYHLPGWVGRPKAEVVEDFNQIAAQDEWVVDGNYRSMSGTLQLRAEAIVFLDFERVFCLGQITKRYLLHKLGVRMREELAAGFDEKMSLAFYQYVWNWPAENRVRWMDQLAPMMDKVVVLKDRKAVKVWLESVA